MSETIRIRPWTDPSSTLWATIRGPPIRSASGSRRWDRRRSLLLRHIAYRFDRVPAGFTLSLAETSRCLGLGEREGRNSPLARSLGRLVQFDLAAFEDEGATLAVRRYVPPVNRRHVRRLPPSLQEEHDAWIAARLAEPPLAAARRNARRMALIMLGGGDSRAEVELALGTAGFNPALAREAAVWGWDQLDRADPVPLSRTACSA